MNTLKHQNLFSPHSAMASQSRTFGNLGDKCRSERDFRNQMCRNKYPPPNPFGDPNISFWNLFTWFFEPSGSGQVMECFKRSKEKYEECIQQDTYIYDCISNYTDTEGRHHRFPCDQICSFPQEKVNMIYGCDGFYPSRSLNPDLNTSKGIVRTCETTVQNWCECPSGSSFSTSTNQCECHNPEYVTYFGSRRRDESFITGYCAPPCPTDQIYDLGREMCVQKPMWY